MGEVRVAFPGATSPAESRRGQDATKDRNLKDNDGRMQRIVDNRFSILSVLFPSLPPFPPSPPPLLPSFPLPFDVSSPKVSCLRFNHSGSHLATGATDGSIRIHATVR